MRILLIALFASPFFVISIQTSTLALDINCDSPVWRKKKPCIGKKTKENSFYGDWFPFGFNKKGEVVNWAQLLSYEELNENSFRLISKFTYPNKEKKEGKLDINCANKDYYIRPKGVMSQKTTWAKIPNGSGVESLAQYFCKNTPARNYWGYKNNTKYLWNATLPTADPQQVQGEWIQHSDGLGWYNTEINLQPKSVIFSYFSTSSGKYTWINSSCIENLSSVFYKPTQSVEGSWLGPKPGRIKGTSMAVKNKYCR